MDALSVARDSAISPDEALIRRARAGDTAAFDALVATRIDRCYRLAWSIVLNDADAADATQDAFVAAWRHLPRLRDATAFDGWLNRIVANASRMTRRHRVRLREVPIVDTSDSGNRDECRQTRVDPSAMNEIDDVADIDAIARAFDRLRPDDRAILALHHVDGRPLAEIAITLGVPSGTAKSRLHAARRLLERAVEAEG